MAASLALIAGCGDGSSQPLSTEQLVEQGDELCRSGQDRFAAIQKEPPANTQQAADQVSELVDAANEEVDGLRDLEPPDEVQQAYDEYISAREDALDLLEDGRNAAEDEDSNAYGAAQVKLSDGAAERSKLARAVGFKVCSNPRAPSGAEVSG